MRFAALYPSYDLLMTHQRLSFRELTCLSVLGMGLTYLLPINHQGIERLGSELVPWHFIIYTVVFFPSFLALHTIWPRMNNWWFSLLASGILGYIAGLIGFVVSNIVGDSGWGQFAAYGKKYDIYTSISLVLIIPFWLMSWYAGLIVEIVAKVGESFLNHHVMR
jgi:hypothetical protein